MPSTSRKPPLKASNLADALRSAAREQVNEQLDSLDNRALIEQLERRGFMCVRDTRAERKIKIDVPKRGRVRFGVVTDTHLGHMKQQLTHLRHFYQQAEKWGAEFMIHGGDLVDGQNMHRDQQFELFKHGVHAQGRYAADVLPKLHGRDSKKVLDQYVIGGNHDGSGWNESGANIFDTITSRRPDLKFLGAPMAEFHVGGLRIMAMHPDGGVPYARSYKLQKIVEQFAPDQKPQILFVGHYHVDCYLPAYRNVHAIMLPCFQAQTGYLKRKALAPVVGGLLCEVEHDDGGIRSFLPKFEIYNRHLENDYP